ncbi:hypothetical protein Forpe1208_v010727 [Fusarium oxysporum f. sp. rapae]|uniref:Uncharacterized protein n=1 Tax=Fusarium oxysporum f. sp. rapae TaxID=485398 RepID=A0A8J5P345_FUSOX|nr:hypothetical protein Forpe1208_v010727 [Fusarium oxysporum f. sp. rapae]
MMGLGAPVTYENKYAWVKYSLKPGNKTRGLLDSRVDSQELKDALLYTFVMEGGFLSSPHSYGTLDRLVIDRLQDCGANINAFAGENGQTLLYEICSRINMAYVKTEKGHLLPGHKHPGVAEMYRVKFQELCLSLVDKGADPGLFIDGLTAVDILVRGTEDDKRDNSDFLVDLASEMRNTRRNFLSNGSTPSLIVKRARIGHLLETGSYQFIRTTCTKAGWVE